MASTGEKIMNFPNNRQIKEMFKNPYFVIIFLLAIWPVWFIPLAISLAIYLAI